MTVKEFDRDQANKDLEYLKHVLRNNVLCIMGLFKMMEGHLQTMAEALKAFDDGVKNDKPNRETNKD